jgi:alanine racemase
MSRGAIAILSTDNLLHNLSVLKKASNGRKIIAMVKANAYGHGLRSVASRLSNHVYSLGVASIDEALALRKTGIHTPITLIEGVFEPDELLVASAQRFHVVFHNETQVSWLETSSLPLPIRGWIKIDSGMGRLGFSLDQAKGIYAQLAQNQQIVQPIGIMSHFGCADDLEHPLNQSQISAFSKFSQGLPGLKSFSNSPALFNFPSSHYDVVRPGIALYGISPLKEKSAEELNLRPVMTLQTRLIAIRSLSKGSSIGYGSSFTCPEDMNVGVVAMGYGDGYPRTARNGTPVLVNHVRCQLVGRVSMDMATIDLRPCVQARVGDPVILWGDKLPIEEVASHTAHVPYDLVTGVQQRVKFHWTLPDCEQSELSVIIR